MGEPCEGASVPAVPDVTPTVKAGKAYLVGAGPGGVGLLTIRALEILTSCDVILHDRLVPLEIIKLAKKSAEVHYAGKDGNTNSDAMQKQQDGTCADLVQFARRGLSVCRLKGGDPMIYGRVGEEMQALAAAGIKFEVVPAVTAALAAGAQARVPLTYKSLATSLRFVTMNASTVKDEKFDWNQFLATDTTYALYMGLKSLPGICEKLVAAGVQPERPIAIVDRASLPGGHTVVGTIGTLKNLLLDRTDLEGPAIALLGDVVNIRAQIACDVKQPPTDELHGTTLTLATALIPTMNHEELQVLRDRVDALITTRKRPTADQNGLPPQKRQDR